MEMPRSEISTNDQKNVFRTPRESSADRTSENGNHAAGTALQSCGLHLYYGQTHALKGIDLEMPERRITALIGPSGCGKSTYLRCFNRMNDMIEGVRVEGQVMVEGLDVHRPDIDLERLRKRIGMVFQKSNPFQIGRASCRERV